MTFSTRLLLARDLPAISHSLDQLTQLFDENLRLEDGDSPLTISFALTEFLLRSIDKNAKPGMGRELVRILELMQKTCRTFLPPIGLLQQIFNALQQTIYVKMADVCLLDSV
jgi:hypothetical protein